MRNRIILALGAILATSQATVVSEEIVGDYPGSWDWRQRSFVVGAVKSQPGGPDASWAFAVASAFEA